MKYLANIAFFVVAAAILAGFHTYLWARLVRDPGWPAPFGPVGSWSFAALAAFVPAAAVASWFLPRSVGGPLSMVAFTWMGTAFFLFLFVAGADLLRLLAWGALGLQAALVASDGAVDPVRRELLARGVAGVAAIASGGFSAVALRSGLGEVEVQEVPVRLPRLPKALSGLTIVQLTDLHVGPSIGRRFMDGIVDQTNALAPDLIAVTGDLVDGFVPALAEHVAPLARLKARHGVFFVTGNHEYYSGAEAWLLHLRKLGLRVLDNERVSVGDAGASFDLAGIPDPAVRQLGGGAPDLEKALAGRDPERELVLLAHRPRQVREAAGRGVGLQLSGHTHGGQIWPFGGLVALTEPYVSGLHRHGELTQIYVSRGTGYWGPPMRFACPAEITKLILTC